MVKIPIAPIAAIILLGSAPATAVERVELGVLDCTVEGGSGLIFGSTKDVICTFDPVGIDRQNEVYLGKIHKWGLNVGTTSVAVMKWAVFAPTTDDFEPGALAGIYVGVSAEATVGVGLGANVLVGGSSETVALQPVSVQAQEGLNFALGVAELELEATAD